MRMGNKVPKRVIDMAKSFISMPSWRTPEEIRSHIDELEKEIQDRTIVLESKRRELQQMEVETKNVEEWLKQIGEYENTNK